MDEKLEKQNSSSFSHPQHNIWKCHQYSPTGKQCFFIAKRNSSSYNIVSMSNWEKASFFPLSILHLYKNGETIGLPKSTFWASQLFASQNFTFPQIFTKSLQIAKSDHSFTRRVPLVHLETSSISQLQRQCPQTRRVPKTECWFQNFQPSFL